MTTVVLGVLWALWPLVALAGGLGFSTLTGIAALVLLPVAARSFRIRPYMLVLMAFFIFAGLSTLWSPRDHALVSIDFTRMQFALRSEMLRVGLQVLALGVLIAAALRLDDLGKTRLQRIAHIALALQLTLLLVLTIFEQDILQMLAVFVPDTGEGVQNISRNSLIMAAAAPLLIIGVARGSPLAARGALIAAVLLAAIAILAVREVHAGLLAIVAAGASIGLVHFLPRWGFKILGGLIALVVISAPIGFGLLTQGADFETATDSASYRAAIWQHVITLINENPIAGNGLGMLRTQRETIETGMFAGQLMVPNHSHNMMLQLWAETGAIGASLLSLTIVVAGWRMGDARKLGAAGLRAAGLAGVMTAVAAVSFDLWNDWWWAVGGLLAVLAVATPAQVRPRMRNVEGAGLIFGEVSPSEATSKASGEERSIADTHSHNNFHLLRLAFALLVVVYHSIALPGVADWKHIETWAGIGAELGVQGFFVLSGYLVWASFQRSPTLGLYAEKRARRLLPGYVTVILVSGIAALVLVPAARADLAQLASYLGWNLVFLNFMAPDIPGVFEANRFTEINGALWTLKIELMFYIILPVLAQMLRLAGKHRWVMFVLIYAGAEIWRLLFEQADATLGGLMAELSRQLPGQMSFFITGIALCAWRNEINWRSMLAPFGLVLLGLSILLPQAEPLRAAGLGIVTVWLAVGIPRLFNAAAFGDLSYGLYMVHFPVIQCAIAAGLFAGSLAMGLAFAGVASLVLALLLWRLIERPALRADSSYRQGHLQAS